MNRVYHATSGILRAFAGLRDQPSNYDIRLFAASP